MKPRKKSPRKPRRPILSVRVTTLPREGVADAPELFGQWVEGLLVDSEGRPQRAPRPFHPIYLKGNKKRSRKDWDFSTADVKVVFEKEGGWEVVLSSGRRMMVKRVANPAN
jgi:hypothetical protein